MQITTQEVELRVDDSLMRVYVAAPESAESYPGILLYSEIFQLTAPILRSIQRLAGHGFVVAAPAGCKSCSLLLSDRTGHG